MLLGAEFNALSLHKLMKVLVTIWR